MWLNISAPSWKVNRLVEYYRRLIGREILLSQSRSVAFEGASSLAKRGAVTTV
jgi:hypothetical protein